MKFKNIALIVYFVCCIVAIFAQVILSETMMIVSRSILFPAIFFYYLEKSKKINLLFSIILFVFYISNIIIMLGFENEVSCLIYPYIIVYLILLKFAIQDVVKVKLGIVDAVTSIIVFGSLVYILYGILVLLNYKQQNLIIPLVIVGSELILLSTIVSYNYIVRNTTSNFYFCICCTCFIISNVFYLLFELIFNFPIFDYISISVQIFSYYFLVKYILNRKLEFQKNTLYSKFLT